MTDRIVTTAEVGSWMQDLGDHFAEIIEDRSGNTVRLAAVDEHGVKWTTPRIEEVTGIPARTIDRMVRKSRSGSPSAAGSAGSRKRRTRSDARLHPEDVTDGILDAPEETQEQIERKLREAREERELARLRREEEDMRARGADPDMVEPFPADLMADAVGIARRADGLYTDIDRLLGRAEADQRPALIDKILPRVRRVVDRLDVGTVKVPDDVSSLDGL